MIDQTTPPFRTGDVAYTRASPGGYASAAAVPVDPAYGGSDNAYICPSLGGEFQPGSGMAAPTSSPITDGWSSRWNRYPTSRVVTTMTTSATRA